MGKPKVFLTGIGMITSVGENTEMTTASVRADISGCKETSHLNKNFDPIKMALVSDQALSPLNNELIGKGLTDRQKRMLTLATPAINEALSSYNSNQAIPLFLAVPESLPNTPTTAYNHFIDYLSIQTEANIDVKNSRIFSTGRTGGLEAIDIAFKYFKATGKDYVLVGGVDSCLDLYLLSMLDSENRIMSRNIMNGFIPGEAAGFLLICSENAYKKYTENYFSTLYQPGFGAEVGHIYSDDIYKGDGLDLALKAAIDNSENQQANTVFSSMNGEIFFAKEYGVAIMRNKSKLATDIQVEHPIDCLGDIGAAFAPIVIGIASIGVSKGYINGPCINLTSSELQQRGAVFID